jgi:hypothetical protein
MVVNMCEEGKENVKMTEDKAVELINEWLELAKEVSDMNLNRVEYDENRYEYAMDRMNVIRQEIQEYHDSIYKK